MIEPLRRAARRSANAWRLADAAERNGYHANARLWRAVARNNEIFVLVYTAGLLLAAYGVGWALCALGVLP